MIRYLKQFILRWLKRQFKGNPIVDQPGEYLPKVGQALSFGLLAGPTLVGVALLLFTGMVIGSLYGWY